MCKTIEAADDITAATLALDDARDRAGVLHREWRALRETVGTDPQAIERKRLELDRARAEEAQAQAAVHAAHTAHLQAADAHRADVAAEGVHMRARAEARAEAHRARVK